MLTSLWTRGFIFHVKPNTRKTLFYFFFNEKSVVTMDFYKTNSSTRSEQFNHAKFKSLGQSSRYCLFINLIKQNFWSIWLWANFKHINEPWLLCLDGTLVTVLFENGSYLLTVACLLQWQWLFFFFEVERNICKSFCKLL